MVSERARQVSFVFSDIATTSVQRVSDVMLEWSWYASTCSRVCGMRREEDVCEYDCVNEL
jgi:hypothetical protein